MFRAAAECKMFERGVCSDVFCLALCLLLIDVYAAIEGGNCTVDGDCSSGICRPSSDLVPTNNVSARVLFESPYSLKGLLFCQYVIIVFCMCCSINVDRW